MSNKDNWREVLRDTIELKLSQDAADKRFQKKLKEAREKLEQYRRMSTCKI